MKRAKNRYCVLVGRDISEEKKRELDLLRFSNIAHFTINPVQITDRGRPIGCIIPAQSRQATEDAARLARLVAEGAVKLGSGRLSRGKPAVLKPGPSILEMLDEERR